MLIYVSKLCPCTAIYLPDEPQRHYSYVPNTLSRANSATIATYLTLTTAPHNAQKRKP